MTTQAERILQQEVMIRLRMYPVVAVPVPNGLWIPARTDAERATVSRIISQMKSYGMMLPGAPDLAVFGKNAAGLIELKRPPGAQVFGRTRKGELTDNQKVFRDRCQEIGINWAQCESWEEVQQALQQWRVI